MIILVMQFLQNTLIRVENALGEARELFKTREIGRALLILPVFSLIILLGAFYVKNSQGYVLNISDEYSFIVKSPAAVNEMVDNMIGTPAAEAVFTGKIDFTKAYLTNGKLSQWEDIKGALEEFVELVPEPIKVYELVVDGKTMGCFGCIDEPKELLDMIKDPYKGTDDVELSFLEDVKIEEVDLGGQVFSCVDEIYECLVTPEDEIITYMVEKGDTLSQIAERFFLKTGDVARINPGLKDEHTLSIGQELLITLPKFPLNVVSKRILVYEDRVPYENIYEDDDEMYKGQTKVKEPGTEGERIVKAQEVLINGIYEDTIIIDEVITLEPVSAIVYRGMKERPRTLAYDEFIMPSRGSISSRFGQRWSSFHTGIDIAARRGTPNRASDGGKVIYADWKGTYGLLVIIDHENGYTTYYAHNDTISVKTGDRVARGDIIGTVGSTGNATGPHLHFEIRKDGVPLNPLDFVD